MGLGELITQPLTDSRRGKNTQLPLADLLPQSVHSRMAGQQEQIACNLGNPRRLVLPTRIDNRSLTSKTGILAEIARGSILL